MGKSEIVRCNGNAFVTLRSNIYCVEPIQRVKLSAKGKGKRNVSQPFIDAQHNSGMGGTNLLDKAMSDLQPIIRGKMWYWSLIINALNISFVYFWRLVTTVSGLGNMYHKRINDVILLRFSTPNMEVRSFS